MASAWGESWGAAWGNSWGAIAEQGQLSTNTGQGRSHKQVIINVMARFGLYEQPALVGKFLLNPSASALTEFQTEFVTCGTSVVESTADAAARYVTAQIQVEYGEAVPHAGAYVAAEGAAAAVEYGITKPSGAAIAGAKLSLAQVTMARLLLEPMGIINPSEEELVMMIRARRRRFLTRR